jgi:hypothetical protein
VPDGQSFAEAGVEVGSGVVVSVGVEKEKGALNGKGVEPNGVGVGSHILGLVPDPSTQMRTASE